MSPIVGGYFSPPTDPWGSYFWKLLSNLDRDREARVRRAVLVVSRYQGFLPLILERYADASRVLAETGLEMRSWDDPDQETMRRSMERSSAAAVESQLQIESFYLFANALCDRAVGALGVVFGERFSGPSTRSAGGFAQKARPHLDSWPGIDELLGSIAALDYLRLHRHSVFVHDDGAGGVNALATSVSIGPPAESAIDHVTLGAGGAGEHVPTAPLRECMADVQRFLDAAGRFLWINAPPE